MPSSQTRASSGESFIFYFLRNRKRSMPMPNINIYLSAQCWHMCTWNHRDIQIDFKTLKTLLIVKTDLTTNSNSTTISREEWNEITFRVYIIFTHMKLKFKLFSLFAREATRLLGRILKERKTAHIAIDKQVKVMILLFNWEFKLSHDRFENNTK